MFRSSARGASHAQSAQASNLSADGVGPCGSLADAWAGRILAGRRAAGADDRRQSDPYGHQPPPAAVPRHARLLEGWSSAGSLLVFPLGAEPSTARRAWMAAGSRRRRWRVPLAPAPDTHGEEPHLRARRLAAADGHRDLLRRRGRLEARPQHLPPRGGPEHELYYTRTDPFDQHDLAA
jgi:hypothetical protein